MSFNEEKNPEDPYASFLVPASAGAGKTYKLSRRFLFLVGAGAEPETILTLTFTKKAAAEMRERILADAASLLKAGRGGEGFTSSLAGYYRAAQKSKRFSGVKLKPPLKAFEVGEKILSSSQTLKITTIDSVFFDWVRKFPYEAARISNGERLTLPPNFSVVPEWEARRLKDKVYQKALMEVFEKDRASFTAKTKIKGGPSIFEWQNHALSLHRLKTFLWLIEQKRGASPFNPHKTKEPSSTGMGSIEDVLKGLKEPLSAIIMQIKKERQPELLEAAYQGDFSSLVRLKLLTKDAAVSGATIRGKKREALSCEIDRVEEALKDYVNQKRLHTLNDIGSHLMDIYQHYSHLLLSGKTARALVEFDDLAMGCFRLQYDPLAAGARYLISRGIRHLMLDEFQDTSLLQWSIFEPICAELLSGESSLAKESLVGLKPSLFIVGDQKQSIYGFREADPEIISSISEPLKRDYGVETAPLNKSFRTSQVILDYVNEVFLSLWQGFPVHETAILEGKEVVPPLGSVLVGPFFDGEDGIRDEASFVAKSLKDFLGGARQQMIFDKETSSYRPLLAKDCCVLFRAATHADVYEEALRAEGLATRREDGEGFLERCEIKDMLCLIKWLAFPDDMASLAAVLKSPLFRVEDAEYLSFLEEKKDLMSLAPLSLRRAQKMSQKALPYEVIAYLFEACHAGQCYREAFGEEEGVLAETNLYLFLERLLEFQKNGFCTFLSLSLHLEDLKAHGDLANAHTKADAVTLMTIHKSKGLEFPLVALVGTGEVWHKRDLYWAKKQDGGSDSGVYYMGKKEQKPVGDRGFDAIYEALDKEALKETERLLYVGMTRARHHLLITGAKKAKAKEPEGFYEALYKACRDRGGALLEDGSVFLQKVIEPLKGADGAIGDKAREEKKQEKEKEKEKGKELRFPDPLEGAPRELLSLAPHRLLTMEEPCQTAGVKKESASLPFKKEVGTVIHEGLYAHVKGESFDVKKAFRRLVPRSSKMARFALSKCEQELGEVLASPFFTSDIFKYELIKPEFEILYLDSSKIIRGAMDLYLEKDGEGVIIDYKTTNEVTDKMGYKELLSFCEEKGYAKQLTLYKNGVLSARKVKRVKTGVYFTSIQKCVFWS